MIEESGTFRPAFKLKPRICDFESKLSFSETYANYILNKSLKYRIIKNTFGIMQQSSPTSSSATLILKYVNLNN